MRVAGLRERGAHERDFPDKGWADARLDLTSVVLDGLVGVIVRVLKDFGSEFLTPGALAIVADERAEYSASVLELAAGLPGPAMAEFHNGSPG